MLQYRQFALLGSMENTGQTWILVVQWNSGQWYLPRGGEASPELLVVSGGPHSAPWSPQIHWDTDEHGPYTVFTNSHRALELQTPAKLSSWPSSSSTPWKSLLPPQVLSISQFLLWRSQGCCFCHLHCQASVLAGPAEKAAWVWAGSTPVPADTPIPACHHPELPGLPAPCSASPRLAWSVPRAR